MRKRAYVVAALAAVGALAVVSVGSYAIAGSGKSTFKAKEMSGYFEPPAVSSAASGSFGAKLVSGAIQYELSYSGLEGTVLQAHIHFGQPATNGGISAWLCGTAANPGPAGTPTCPASGTVTGTITPAAVVGPAGQGIALGQFDELVSAMRAGATYANVHSMVQPGGEIRAQIKARNGDDEGNDGDENKNDKNKNDKNKKDEDGND